MCGSRRAVCTQAARPLNHKCKLDYIIIKFCTLYVCCVYSEYLAKEEYIESHRRFLMCLAMPAMCTCVFCSEFVDFDKLAQFVPAVDVERHWRQNRITQKTSQQSQQPEELASSSLSPFYMCSSVFWDDGGGVANILIALYTYISLFCMFLLSFEQ